MKRSVLLLAVLILIASRGVVWAHGGGTPQLVNADAGPYWMSVWTQPDPLRVGQAHVTVAVSEPTETANGLREAGNPILNADVRVRFVPLDGAGALLEATATHEGASNKLFYEADVALTDPGRWEVQVAVDGPNGSGNAAFEAQVAPPQAPIWPWVGGAGVLVLAGAWVVGRIRRQNGGN
jgi:hypothetical protein